MKTPQISLIRSFAHQGALILALVGPGMILTTPIAIQDINDEVIAIQQQSTGHAVIAGRFGPTKLLRLFPDGTHDESFVQSWMIDGFNRDVLSVAVQVDDQIVVGGEFTSFDDTLAGHILRLNQDGTVDRSFVNAIGTGFDGPVSAIAIQPDGKILAGGAFTSFDGNPAKHIARLNQDGSWDGTFNPEEGFDNPVFAIKPLPSGQIVVGGQFSSYRSLASPYIATLQRDAALESP